jgi:hypothetical protein
MGFVNLPVEGDPVSRLPEVLDQIQAALEQNHARTVRRIGNRIEFSTDSFLRRWLFRDRFRASSGEIEAEASSDSLMIDYRLSFFELIVVTTLAVLSSVFALAFHGGIAFLRSHVSVVLFACALSFGLNTAVATSRFSRFLRQFPREVGDS